MNHTTNVTAVPEPGTLLLLVVVLAVGAVFFTSRKARPWVIALLCAGGLFLMLLFVGFRFYMSMCRVGSPPAMASSASATRPMARARAEGDGETIKEVERVMGHYTGDAALPRKETKAVAAPASAASGGDKAVKKAEAEPSVVIAARAVGMVEAIGRALSGMLVEEKKPPVAKKLDAEAAPAPISRPAKSVPAWVKAPPRVVGDSYLMSIVVGPWKTRQECEAELPKKLQKALDDYTDACQPGARHVVLPASYLRDHLVKERWEEEIMSETPSIGTMKQLHVLLQFDNEVKNVVADANHRAVVAVRLGWVGAVVAAGFWLLGVVYGYLRIDLATGGIYRGRLRLAAGLAILGPMAAVLAVVS